MNYQKIEIKNNAKSLIEEYKQKHILLTEFIKRSEGVGRE